MAVVNCVTQEQWDFVTEKLKYKWKTTSKWSMYGKDTCININEGMFSPIDYYKKKGEKIYSFDEWCKINNYDNPFDLKEFKKGDYIVFLNNSDSNYLKNNHCYIHDGKYTLNFSTSKDSKNEHTWSGIVKYNSNLWRYAIKEEIDEYDRLGKPFDVTTLNKSLTVENLVEGEIYSCEYQKNTDYIFKYKGASSYYCFEENNYQHFSKSSWSFWEKEKIRIATKEEKQWLEACIKANKFISKEEALKAEKESYNKFKIGDWVYAEKQIEDDYRNNKYIPIFKIDELSFQNKNIWLRPEGGEGTGIIDKNCRLATFEEIERYLSSNEKKEKNFKVGDYVMISEEELPINSNWLGEGGRIQRQGPFKITKISQDSSIIYKLDDIGCTLVKGRFRHATKEEINNYLIVDKPHLVGFDPIRPINNSSKDNIINLMSPIKVNNYKKTNQKLKIII